MERLDFGSKKFPPKQVGNEPTEAKSGPLGHRVWPDSIKNILDLVANI